MKAKQVKELATALGVAIAACILAVSSTRYLTFVGGFEMELADPNEVRFTKILRAKEVHAS